MKKRAIVILLLSIIIMTAFTPAANALSIVSSDTYRTEKVVKDYLSEAAYSQYLYENRNLDKYTIASVPGSRTNKLIQMLSDYPAFRSERGNLLHQNSILSSTKLSDFRSNLDFHKKSIAHYADLGKASNTEYKYFNPSYRIIKTDVNGNLACVELYEQLDFQYVELDDDSMMLTHYFISLVKSNGRWLILAVESDDMYYESQMVKCGAIKLDDSPVDSMNPFIADRSGDDSEDDGGSQPRVNIPPEAGLTDRLYNPNNAVNYALTFTRGGTANGSSGASVWANTLFYHSAPSSTGGNCQRFASECIWAGLGGSNTAYDISIKRLMDNQGSTVYQKWYGASTSTGEAHPWISTYYFNQYVQNVDLNDYKTDLICKVSEVGKTQSNLTAGTIKQGTAVTHANLLGAVLQIPGASGYEFGHAIIVTKVPTSSSSRDSVFVSAYSKCYRNIKLSILAPYSNNNGNEPCKVLVIVPLYMRNGNPSGGNYLYGDLIGAVQNGDSATVKGYALAPVSSLKLKIYNPSNTLVYTVNASNSDTVSKTLNFYSNSDGYIWRIEVSGTGVTSYTYLVRVADSANGLLDNPNT